MKRAELKQILEKISPESRRFYRLSPTLYRDLVLWEDYLQCIELNRKKKYRAVKKTTRGMKYVHNIASAKRLFTLFATSFLIYVMM